MSTLAVGAVTLALVVPGAQAQPKHHHRRPGCAKLFTVKMGERAARAIYSGTRQVSKANFFLLGRIEMCQRNPVAQPFVRHYDHHQRALWRARRDQPAPTIAAGWAIPWPIVNCESGGQNLAPNSAGASGYYQIIPETWASYGGAGPAAYLASKAEQDGVASRIWAGGSGASQWVCAGLTGY